MGHRSTNPEIEIIGGYPALGRVEQPFDVPATQVTETMWVNRDMELDSKGDPDFRKTWNVTHLPTGWAMVRWLPSKAAAQAAARWLAALGFDGIETEDPKEADAKVIRLGIQKAKLWLANAIESLSTEKLIKALQKDTRTGQVSEAPRQAAKRSERRPPKKAAKKGAKKKAAKKKAAKKSAKAERAARTPPAGAPDFMQMLREADDNPLGSEDAVAKSRLLEW